MTKLSNARTQALLANLSSSLPQQIPHSQLPAMEAVLSHHHLPLLSSPPSKTLAPTPNLTPSHHRRRGRLLSPPLRSTRRTSVSAAATEMPETVDAARGEFAWMEQWYPVAPVCDLDRRAPHGKTVLGLDLVVWFDRNAGGGGEWRVFEDRCPHRLAPLSEGRVDLRGRLQCVYHGWCFGGAGECQFIPQAPALGPPVHKNSKACVAVYPSVVQNDIVWFWPSADPKYKDILKTKRPPYVPELDDPSFTCAYGMRDIFYGYDVLIENLMDSAHVPYAHKGLLGGISEKPDPGRVETDQEGGSPVEIKILESSIGGFLAKQEIGHFQFIAPCLFYGSAVRSGSMPQEVSSSKPQPDISRILFIFMCIPVGPGRSRLIYAFPRNFPVWLDKFVPRWVYHMGKNLILDSDLYLLHVEERKLAAAGLSNWHNACYVPTSSDNMVIAFRNWFRKYCKCQIGWGTAIAGQLPPTPPKDQLLDRYWSHVVQCSSCRAALKGLQALEIVLQVTSIAVVGFLAVAKQSLVTSVATRTTVVSVAVLCFIASRWLSDFIYKNFYFQDYNHAFK